MQAFRECFSQLPDPRAANAQHDLVEILFIALAAVLCGAQGCTDMALFGRAKEPLLRQILRLEHGIPSHDTFSRVFRLLDPQAFEAAMRRFVGDLTKALRGVVAVDGKALRRAFERGRRSTPLHLVNVFAAEARLALAQHLAPNRNEVAGALQVLDLLSLQGCIVTADALHCHAKMAEKILERGGAYVLALKQNQSALFAEAQALLACAGKRQEAAQSQPASHGREEHRQAVVVRSRALARKHGFPGLAAVACLTLQRRVNGRARKPIVRYFVLSKPFSPSRLLALVRDHWSIENQLHWVLDVVFEEDRARSRKDNGAENLAIVRKLALNLLRSQADTGSIRGKIKRAGWDDAFLLSLFGHMQ